MTNPIGTTLGDVQSLPKSESSTGLYDCPLSVDWNSSEDFRRGSPFMAYGDGESIKPVENFVETIKGDYVVYIREFENDSNTPTTVLASGINIFDPVIVRMDPVEDFGFCDFSSVRYRPSILHGTCACAIHDVVNHRDVMPYPRLHQAASLLSAPQPDLDANLVRYQRKTLQDLWQAPLEFPVRIENVVKHGINDNVSGTSPLRVGRDSIDSANSALTKALGLIANLSPDLGVGLGSYGRQTGDVLSRNFGYSPGSPPGTDFKGHARRRVYVQSELERAFRDGSEEVFEYGMESKFSRNLNCIIKSYSNDAVVELEMMLAYAYISLDVMEECLLQLGAIEHKPTSEGRLSLLIDHLRSNYIGVRDCAALGIASMDEPSAIQPLQHAVRVEKSDRLQEDLQLVLDQLIATRNAQVTESHS